MRFTLLLRAETETRRSLLYYEIVNEERTWELRHTTCSAVQRCRRLGIGKTCTMPTDPAGQSPLELRMTDFRPLETPAHSVP